MPNNKNTKPETKKIGEGGFGCVFHPAVTCNGKVDDSQKKDEYVSKIQKQDQSSKNEIEISKVISKISGYEMHFAPILEACDVGISKINENIISQCEAYEKYQHESQLSIFKMKYVNNISLSKAIITKNKSNKNNMLADYFECYRYLLSSLEMLEKAGIVHFDLKSENVIYDKNKNIPIVIDFGLSFFTNSSKYGGSERLAEHVFYVYEPKYYLWPIEVHFANMLRHKYTSENDMPSIAEVHKMCLEYVNNCKGFSLFSDNFKARYAESAVGFLKKYLKMEKKKAIKDLLTYAKTWDNYALGIAFLRIMHHFFEKGFPKNQLIINFSQLLLINCHPDPTQRLTIAKTISKFKNVFVTDEKVSGHVNMINAVGSNDEIINSIKADQKELTTMREDMKK